jgi:NAD(P)-dependent dehydrogenase (short-subunit alcohol dehydrogenase family)
MMKVFNINTIGPAIIAKYFLPKFRRDTKTVFAVLSARVGSINDNYLGGWASYRASKAALNMLIKTSAIEQKRIAPKCILTSLHPGTVDTELSRPYQKNIKKGALSNASNAASKLISVINNLNYDDTGSFLAWDGNQIEY